MRKVRALMVISMVAFLASCSSISNPGSTASTIGPELKQAHRFTLPGLDNEAVSLDQTLSKNKAVLVNFWATWCAYCVEEMPDLVKLQARLKDKGFTVVAVDVGESSEQASLFAKKMGLNFPIALDSDNTVAQNYGLVGIPVSYLVTSEGKILGEYHGFSPKLVSDVEDSLKGPAK